jgi:hypothetical protein
MCIEALRLIAAKLLQTSGSPAKDSGPVYGMQTSCCRRAIVRLRQSHEEVGAHLYHLLFHHKLQSL